MESIDYLRLLAFLAVIVLLVLGARRLDSRWPRLLKQLNDELLERMPVYSAETTRGKEAEFIRDRLPKKFPARLALLLLIVFAAVAWWLTN